MIPSSAAVLGNLCFSDAQIKTRTFEANSKLSKPDHCFHHFLSKMICLPTSIQVVGGPCFFAKSITTFIAIHQDSGVSTFHSLSFKQSSVKVSWLPGAIAVMAQSWFEESPKEETLHFRSESKLRRLTFVRPKTAKRFPVTASQSEVEWDMAIQPFRIAERHSRIEDVRFDTK
jgi:hypothetical protein